MPQISGKEVGRVLSRIGFQLRSQRGDHMKFVRHRQYGKETIIVPDHKILRKGTLHGILKQLNLATEELRELL